MTHSCFYFIFFYTYTSVWQWPARALSGSDVMVTCNENIAEVAAERVTCPYEHFFGGVCVTTDSGGSGVSVAVGHIQ